MLEPAPIGNCAHAIGPNEYRWAQGESCRHKNVIPAMIDPQEIHGAADRPTYRIVHFRQWLTRRIYLAAITGALSFFPFLSP
jgi:hypothetical protein